MAIKAAGVLLLLAAMAVLRMSVVKSDEAAPVMPVSGH
jgi:hypothetical protein